MTMPTDLDLAQSRLGGIASAVVTLEWERAAILATYVELSQRGVGIRQNRKVTHRMSTLEFAGLNLPGLRHPATVRRYVAAWTAYRPAPDPGEQVDLDGLPAWPPPEVATSDTSTLEPERREALVAAAATYGLASGTHVVEAVENVRAVQIAVLADPELRRAVREALAEAEDARDEDDHARDRHRARTAAAHGGDVTATSGDTLVPPGTVMDDLVALVEDESPAVLEARLLDVALALRELHHHVTGPTWSHDVVPRVRRGVDEVTRALDGADDTTDLVTAPAAGVLFSG